MSEQIEEGENEEIKEFKDFINKYKPREVSVIWEGVFSYQTWHDPHFPDYLVNHYYYTIEAKVRNKFWSIKKSCWSVAEDTAGIFGVVLQEMGYEMKERYGAVGRWTYVYTRPVIRKITTKSRIPRSHKELKPDEGLGPIEKGYLVTILENGGTMKKWILSSQFHTLAYDFVNKRIQSLVKRGLIVVTHTPPRGGATVTLTSLGVEVAKRLQGGKEQ